MSTSLLNFLNPHVFQNEDKKKNVAIGGKDPFFADVTHPETSISTDFPQLQEDEIKKSNIYKIHDMSLNKIFKKINEQIEKSYLDQAKIFVHNNLDVLHNAVNKFSVSFPHPTSKKVFAKSIDELIRKIAKIMKEHK